MDMFINKHNKQTEAKLRNLKHKKKSKRSLENN